MRGNLKNTRMPHRIVAIGGSNVHGYGDPSRGGFIGRFRAWFEAKGERNRVFNLGVGGDTVRDMLDRGPSEAQHRRPELILLYPGFNDIRRTGARDAPRTSTGEYVELLAKLYAQLSELAPTVLMTGIPLDEARTAPIGGDYYFLGHDAAEFSYETRQLGARRGSVVFDIFHRWLERPDWRSLLADGLHCNSVGHRLLAGELRDFLLREFS
jgi:lysophospholipase L1-like esterase